MTFTTVDPAVADYVVLCEEHLRDLPPEVAARLRADVEEIVTEVCAELHGEPGELVGPPLRFITELRTAAGLPPPPGSAGPAGTGEQKRGLRDRAQSLRDHGAAQWVRHLLPELRPAWWVARGFVLAVALGQLTGGGRPAWFLGLLPYWPVFGSRLLGLATIGAAVYLSVEAGRRTLSGAQRVLRGVASGLAVVAALVLLGEARSWSQSRGFSSSIHHPHPPAPSTPGVVDDGFPMVEIGSRVTGERIPVLHLNEARQVVARLLASGPPASILIERGGAPPSPQSPRSADDIEATLQALVANGFLTG